MFRRRGRGGPGDADNGQAEAGFEDLDDQDEADYDDDAQYDADGEYEDADDLGYAGQELADAAGEAAPGDDLDEAGDLDEAAAAGGRRFRRAGRSEHQDLGDPATWTRVKDPTAATHSAEVLAGPWDSAADYPQGERMDFGSLLVPAREGYDVQILFADELDVTIMLANGESGIQLQAFAAPKTSGIWAEVREELAEEVAGAGGSSVERDGPFGPELHATVEPVADGQQLPRQQLRFLGADGPRWFLRGLISGPAAVDSAQAGPFEEIFADVVVVRGDHAEPPRQPLRIQLPDEARQAFGLEPEQPEQNFLNPFERGPEITETR